MRSSQLYRLHRPIVFLVMIVSVLLLWARLSGQNCERKMIAIFVSPNRDWNAELDEEICSSLGIATTGVSDIVRLARRDGAQADQSDVVAVDETGVASRPALRWLAPQELQISVPNKSLIAFQKSSYEGIGITIQFEPDDPAEREQWLKSLGLSRR